MKRKTAATLLLGCVVAVGVGTTASASASEPVAPSPRGWERAGSYPAATCPDEGAKRVRENPEYTHWNCDEPDPGWPTNRILFLYRAPV